MTTHPPTFRLAAIQAEPVFFNRKASTEKACRLIQEAGKMGATIAAFSETWLPGYPFFIWGASTDPTLLWKASAEYLANAIEIPGAETEALCKAAQRAKVDVVIGVVELDEYTKGSAYCTLLFIGKEGHILGRHRKLKPTHRERTVWGEGDGTGLTVYQRPYGRISGLNCWEHNMVLPGYVLMSQGTQIHAAVWPGSEGKAPPAPSPMWERQLLLSRAFASQSAAYVILVGGLLNPDSIPAPYRELAAKYRGDSFIIDPRGEVIAGPARGETILIAEGSLEQVLAAKSAFDVAGHYSRPDIFQLEVNKSPYCHVVERKTKDHASEAGSPGGPASEKAGTKRKRK